MITVYGHSDDLIEVEGAISEEFTYTDPDEPGIGDLLAFSDGTILRIEYTVAGTWRITPVVHGSAELSIQQTSESSDGYSDVATLVGDVRWVVQGIGHALGGDR